MRTKTKLWQPKVKGIQISAHPDFYAIVEAQRRRMEKRGIKASQKSITGMIAQRFKKKYKGLGLIE